MIRSKLENYNYFVKKANTTNSDKNNKRLFTEYGEHKLYNSSENPIFSFIFDIDNILIHREKIFDLISSLLEQTFLDIQIIYIYNSSEYPIYDNKFKQSHSFIKKMEYYNYYNNTKIHILIEAVNKIKGKYLIIINKYV